MSGIVALLFLAAWAIAPPVVLFANWATMATGSRVFFSASVIAAEFLLVVILALMNGLSHGGIFNWKFWFS